MIEGGGEDDVRDAGFAFDEFFQDTETVEAGHLHVEKNEVWRMFFDEVDGFEAVFALRDQINFGKGFEEKGEFVPGGLFVVDDEGVDGHMGGQTQYKRVGRAKKDEDRSRNEAKEGIYTEYTEGHREDRDGLPQRHRGHREGERIKRRPTQSQRGKIGEFDYTAERRILPRSVHGEEQCRKETGNRAGSEQRNALSGAGFWVAAG